MKRLTTLESLLKTVYPEGCKALPPKVKPEPFDFRVWDGEGRNFPDGSHRLVLLSNSDEEYIYNAEGLSTIECFKFLLKPRDKKRNVWFAFGYDVNKILCDVPLRKANTKDLENLQQLWKRNTIYWKGFKIKYIPRKVFSVSLAEHERFYSVDTFSFFQTSFLNACSQWGIDATAIASGKADRSIFDTYSFDDLLTYNFLELRYAKELIIKLYKSFKDAHLIPKSWHGPGALAGTYFKKHKIDKHFGRENVPKEMLTPIRHAYFGGRIDIAAIGEIECHQYDLISAYPHALTDCISLNCFWSHNYPWVNDRHALYHVKWNIPRRINWGPFPWRKENGTVLFPTSGEGWYWGVEVLAAERLFPKEIKRIEAYYPMVIKQYPLKEAIEHDFEQRKLVGKKTGAGIAIKLILNSLYGKLCQSVGDHKWQNYIWAGYTTAFTRSKILDAIRNVGDENIVAIATDGLYTRKKLCIDDQKLLGSWEYEGAVTLLLVGAGLYTVISDDKIQVVKSRGMPANLNHGWVLRSWGCETDLDGIGENNNTSHYTQFVGMGIAIHQHKPFGIFRTETKKLENVINGGTSKRFPCIAMLYKDGWKEMPLRIRERNRKRNQILSAPYNKNMRIVEELRQDGEVSEA